MDSCEYTLITQAKWSYDGKMYRLPFCLTSECQYNARYCLVKFYKEIAHDKPFEVMSV